MQEIRFYFSKVNVLRSKTSGPDTIVIHLKMPSPFPGLNDPGTAQITTQRGYGEQYCRDVLHVPEKQITTTLIS